LFFNWSENTAFSFPAELMYSRLFAFLYLPAGRFASIRVQKKSASVFYTLGGLYVITVPDYSTFRIADYGSRITDYGLMYLNPQSRNAQSAII